MVFVTVKLKSTDEATLKAFNAAVKPVKQILECHMVGGGFDYLLKIRVRDMGEYRDILGGMHRRAAHGREHPFLLRDGGSKGEPIAADFRQAQGPRPMKPKIVRTIAALRRETGHLAQLQA